MNNQEAVIKENSVSLLTVTGWVIVLAALMSLQQTLSLTVNQGQQSSWIIVPIIGGLAWLGLLLAGKTGFAPLWSADVSNWQRFGLPLFLGLGLGAVMVLTELVNPLGADLQTRFPDSLIVFTQAGLVEEVIFHLFLTTGLVWLGSNILMKGRRQTTVFWIVTVGISLLYWLMQVSAVLTYFPEKFSIILTGQMLLMIGATLTLGAYLFRRWGFWAALSLRYGFYLVWHILWAGGIGAIQYILN